MHNRDRTSPKLVVPSSWTQHGLSPKAPDPFNSGLLHTILRTGGRDAVYREASGVPVAKRLFLACDGPARCKAAVRSHAQWRREDTVISRRTAYATQPSMSALEQEIQVKGPATESVRKQIDIFLAQFL